MKNNELIYINARFLTQPISGVQRFAIEISKELKKSSNLNIKWVAPKNIIHQELAKELDVIQTGKLSGHVWEQIELPIYLQKVNKPLLVNLCNTAPIFYKNKVSCVHDMAFMHKPEWFSKKFSTVYQQLIPQVVKSSKHILTVSEFSKSEIQKYVEVLPENISVIYNGVGNDFFHDSNISKKKYILAVGSLDPRKNFQSLVEVFSNIKDEELEIIIVGSEGKVFSNPMLKTLIENDTRIKLTGYVEDEQLIKLYQEALLFVYPSKYEGFGIPPLEAMKSGTLSVVSDIPVFREVYKDHVQFAKNAKELREKIQAIISLDENEYRIRVEENIDYVNRFTWDSSSKKLNEILQKI